MDESEYKSLALKIAEETPRHLDQPTTPPIHWRVEGEGTPQGYQLRVLLADGRTVRGVVPVPARGGPIPPVGAKRAKYPEGASPTPARTSNEGAGVMALPARTTPAPQRGEVGVRPPSGNSFKPQVPLKPQVPQTPQKPQPK
jgi:hypothetical protein